MEAGAIHERLRQRFEAAIGELDTSGSPWIEVTVPSIAEVCRYLRDEPELRFDCLMNQSAVDWNTKPVLQVVYHLFSYEHRHHVVLKVNAPRDNPVVPTVENVWKIANWLEREIYDLMGVIFEGHSDLRRLLMPEDWVGHPARKDFVEPKEYHGISTHRESLVDRAGLPK